MPRHATVRAAAYASATVTCERDDCHCEDLWLRMSDLTKPWKSTTESAVNCPQSKATSANCESFRR